MKLLLSLFTCFVVAAVSFAQDGPLLSGDSASFVADKTYPDGASTNPDGSPIKTSAMITKTWTIHNKGMREWKDRILKIDGDPQGFTLVKSVPFSTPSHTDIDVSVILKTPAKKGHYKVRFKQYVKDGDTWKLALPNKQAIYIDINIK